MKKLITTAFIILMLCVLLAVSVVAETPQCQRQKVNIITNAELSAETDDENVRNNLDALIDGNKSSGVESSGKETILPITFSFASPVQLDEVVITIRGASGEATASGNLYGKIQIGADVDVYIYPDDGNPKVVNYKSNSDTEIKIDLSTFEASVKEIEIQVHCNSEINHPLWEVEAFQYKGNHAWGDPQSITLQPTCEEKGKGVFKCSCGAEATLDIDAKGHNASDYKHDATIGMEGGHYKVCSVCSKRVDVGEHVYDHPCDKRCNICNYTRAVEPHTYRGDKDSILSCATVCEKCGEAPRTTTKAHTYTGGVDGCDRICDICLEERTVELEHTYDNACDVQCNVCHTIRETEPHKYTNDATCDEYCDICNAKRDNTPAHTYSNGADCDPDCQLCGGVRETTIEHKFSNNCDPTCNRNCGFRRTPQPCIYDNDCDSTCNECNTKNRDVDHEYDNACDASCNRCGSSGVPSKHVYGEPKVTVKATEKRDGVQTVTCEHCGKSETQLIPKLESKSNLPIIIAVVASVVVVGACAMIAVYSLVIKRKKEEKKRKLAEYMKRKEEEERLAREAEEADEEEEELPLAFGGSMYDDSENTADTSAFAGIGIGIGYEEIGNSNDEAETDGEEAEE